MNLNNFFNPQKIAIVGATSDPKKVGFALMSNLLKGDRIIFPVSISEKEIMGIKTFSSLLEIEEDIDLAIIAIRADLVFSILENCSQKKINSVVIISAGFKEIGEEGVILEKKITEMAKTKGIRILGPNCLGIVNSQNGLNATFSHNDISPGSISFLSQSGALGTSILDMAFSEGVGFSKFISLGNEADLTELDFLEFLKTDKDTKAILVYLEKTSDGMKFMELAREISKTKPIVVLKAGASQEGAKAVSSHTGSLAPDSLIFSTACKQSGIIEVSSIREFFNMAKLFQMDIINPIQKIIILTNGGGPSVVATDLISNSKSLMMADLSDKTKNELKKVLPSMASVQNPVDIIGDALSDRFEKTLEILTEEKNGEAILFLTTPQMMTEIEETASLVKKYFSKKMIIPVFMGGEQMKSAKSILKENKMVNFDFPSDAISSLDLLAFGLSKDKANVPKKSSDDNEIKMMNFEKTISLLGEYGIIVDGVFVKDRFELSPVLKKMKLENFVMKAISPQIIHKTDSGAVVLNLKNISEAEKAWDEIKERNPKAIIEGMIVQPMTSGKEVIIGTKRDVAFGSVIIFGLGGIFAEALKDTSMRVGEISKEEAIKMMSEIKGIKILKGMRGEKTVDFDSLAEILSNLSRLAKDHPEIKEIDLNPVMVSETGATIVDVRVMI